MSRIPQPVFWNIGPILCLLILSASGAIPASPAQISLATVRGNVTDSSGAPLSGVVLAITSAEDDRTRSTVTDDSGSFALTFLAPGTYSISAERNGYKRFVREGIKLHLDQTAPLRIVLEAAAAQETIRSKADVPLIETQLSSGGTVLGPDRFLAFPLHDRDYARLALLAPGVLPAVPPLQFRDFRGALNVNSSRSFSNAMILDGMDNLTYANFPAGGSTRTIQPSLEAIQEFKVIAHSQPAEYGRNSGSVLLASTRSGTNALHGSIYDFFQGRSLSARNFFDNAYGMPSSEWKRHQFGASMGGPAGNRTLWYADYEGVQGREGTLRVAQVPGAEEKAGIFSHPVYDPFQPERPQFPRNEDGRWIIPESRWDPVGAKMLSLVPSPNVPGTLLYANAPVTNTRANQFDVRLDRQARPNLDLFGRYSFADGFVNRPGALPGLAEGSFDGGFGTNRHRSHGILLGATWAVTPSAMGDFRFGWTRGDYSISPNNAGVDGPAAVGLGNVPDAIPIRGGLPAIHLEGFDSLGRNTSNPQSQDSRHWTGKASFSLARGRHLYKYGIEAGSARTRIDDSYGSIGNLTFESRFTGNSIGDLLTGLPSQLGLTNRLEADLGQSMVFLYFQDDFQITPKFSWNYGVRYEYVTPPREAHNRLANFDVEWSEWLYAKDGSTFKRALIHPDQKNWGPRIGAAYAIAPRWVIRGAYGRYYMLTLRQGRDGMLAYNPPYMTDSLLAADVTGSSAVFSAAPFRLVNGYPDGLLDPEKSPLTLLRRAQDIYQRVPYTQSYYLGIQFEIAHDAVLDVSYVGNKGNKLPSLRNLNQKNVIPNPDGSQSAGWWPYAGNGDIQYMENRGTSTYHSLQARLEKRFSKGFSALLSHTWGKTMAEGVDALSNSYSGTGYDTGARSAPQDANNLRAERGPADFDRTHRFVAGYVLDLPWGHGRSRGNDGGRFLNLLLGGWQLSGIHVVQGGLPLTPRIGGSAVLFLGRERAARPNQIGSPTLPESERTVERWFNTAAFAAFDPAPRAFGNAGVGILRGPRIIRLDFSLSRNIDFSEKRRLQLRADCFNALNHANLNQPDMRYESAGFGRITTAGQGRLFQFAARLAF